MGTRSNNTILTQGASRLLFYGNFITMTVTATSYTPLTYNGNGSTSVFNITFQFYEVAVIHIDSSGSETEWTENTHYTVTGGEGSTGSITATPTVPATGEKLRIERRTSKDQPRDYDLDNAVLEAALQQSDDRLAMILQELDYDNRRRPAISKANYTAEVEFPTASTGDVLSWGSDGNLVNIALLDLDGVAISALTTTASLEDTDLLPLYDNSAGDNAAITWANVKTAVSTALNLGALAALDTVDAAQLEDDAVTTAKIIDGAVTEAKLASGLELGGPSLGDRSIIRYNERIIKTDVSLWEYNTTCTADDTADTIDKGTDDSFANKDIVQLSTTGTLPAGLATATDYYVRDITASTLKLAATETGAAIDITDTGTGTHTIYKPVNGMTVGPIVVGDGVTVTVKDGSTWSVV